MASTTFTDGTVIQSAWANDVDIMVYGPLHEGADNTGVSNSDTAFQTWLNTIAGKTGYVPAGTYSLTTQKTIASNTRLILDPDAILDFSGANIGTTCFSIAGTQSSDYTLTADAAIGTRTLTVASTSGLSEGDYIRIYSNALWDPDRTSSKTGEIAIINSLTSTTITVEWDLKDSYNTADSAAFVKLTQVQNVYIEGGLIKGNSTDATNEIGFKVDRGRNITFRNVRFENIDNVMISVWNTVNLHVENCSFFRARASGTAYGVSFVNAAQDCSVSHCYFNRVRHSLSTNNSNTDPGIVRRITFSENNVVDSEPATGGTGGDAIDTHAGAEDIYIINNTVQGSTSSGINIECTSAVVQGNKIYDTVAHGIIATNFTRRAGRIQITGNYIQDAGNDGIRVGGGTGSSLPYSQVIVSNNIINTTTNVGIYVTGRASFLHTYTAITGNSIIGAGNTNASLYVDQVENYSVTGNVLNTTVSNGNGIRCGVTTAGAVSGNVVKLVDSSTGIGIYFSTSGTNSTCVGNTVYGTNLSSATGVRLIDTMTNITVDNNNVEACGSPIIWGTGTGHKGGTLYGSATYDPPSLADGAGVTTTVTVTRAVVGDVAEASFSNALQGILLTAWVSGTNTVSVRFQNETGGTIDLASGTLKAAVRKI